MKKLTHIAIILLLCACLVACNRSTGGEYIPFVSDPGLVYDFPDDVLEAYSSAIERVPFIAERGLAYDFSSDAAETVAFVEAVHPNFIMAGRMCMEEYEFSRDKYLAATASPMTHTEFTLATQHFLTVFNDGHLSRTFLMRGQVWDPLTEEYAWEIMLFQDGCFIDKHFLARGDRLFLADDNFIITNTEVLAIGGTLVADIFAVVDYYFGAYNNAGIQRVRGRYARYQLMLQLAGAEIFICRQPSSEDDDYNSHMERLVIDITVLENGVEHVMQTGFTSLHPSSYRLPGFELPYYQRWEMMDDVFYISLRSLEAVYPYTSDMQHAIRQAVDRGIRNFIIDLRNTPGGNPWNINYIVSAMGATLPGHGKFMRIDDIHREHIELHYPPPTLWRYFSHLTPQDFIGQDYMYVPRDHGRSRNTHDIFIIALTSERTFSGGTTVAVEIADSGFGKIIGEPSPTAPTGYGFGRQIILPNSGLQIRPHYTFYLRPDINADQFILVPDIHVNEWEALDTALEFFRLMNTGSSHISP